jgi:hypothetical protein
LQKKKPMHSVDDFIGHTLCVALSYVGSEQWYTFLSTRLLITILMNTQYYDFSVPIFVKGLQSLAHLLEVAQTFSRTNEGGEAEVLAARLAPDMFPFVRQVQIACDNAKGAPARLANVMPPVFEDIETTLAELTERVAKTRAYLETLKPEQFVDAGERRIELPYFTGKHFLGADYLKAYAIPNFFFHLTTAYDILRAHGAHIGKADFMYGIPLRDN